MADVEARVELNTLLDFYGKLLTEHRREVIRLYCEEDLTLSEIAAELGITRQGVGDALQKGRRQLLDYEQKLGLIARERALSARARRAARALEGMDNVSGEDARRLREARAALEEILREG